MVALPSSPPLQFTSSTIELVVNAEGSNTSTSKLRWQSLASSRVRVYIPALKSIKSVLPTTALPIVDQLNEYEGKPPEASILIEPSLPPLQLTDSTSWDILSWEGWKIEIVSELV